MPYLRLPLVLLVLKKRSSGCCSRRFFFFFSRRMSCKSGKPRAGSKSSGGDGLCPKEYHLRCTGLNAVPKGDFFGPCCEGGHQHHPVPPFVTGSRVKVRRGEQCKQMARHTALTHLIFTNGCRP